MLARTSAISLPEFGQLPTGTPAERRPSVQPDDTGRLIDQVNSSVQLAVSEAVNTRAFRTYRGNLSKELEETIQQRFNAVGCLITSSGTAAIEIALRSAGIQSGQEVLLSAYDYPGNFWAIERAGGRPLLIDTEAGGWAVDLNGLRDTLSASPNCRAVVISHLHGQIQNAAEIRRVCDERAVTFIEDCCQAIGGVINDRPVGSFGHAAVLSFGGSKLISAGRGGALLLNEAKLNQRSKIASGAGSGPYGLSELQAAVVLAQMPWLDQLNRHCCQFFSELEQHLKSHSEQMEWRLQIPSADDLERATTSIYQAGCLLVRNAEEHQASISSPSNNSFDTSRQPELTSAFELMSDRLTAAPAAFQQSFGHGFAGFYRRSTRRCRVATQLENAPAVSKATVVLHHRLALEERLSASEVAESLLTALRNSPN